MAFLSVKQKRWQQPRAAARFNTVGIRSPFGETLDMSARGMRVKLGSKPDFAVGDLREIFVQGPTQKLKVTARVAWIKKPTLGRSKHYEAGLEFVNVKPGMDRVLGHFAEHGFVPKSGFKVPKQQGGSGSGQKKPASDTSTPTVVITVPDLYALLEVDPSASDEEIRKAHRKLAKELHPDANPDGDTVDRFSAVTKAFSVLRDSEMRAEYDERYNAMIAQQQDKQHASESGESQSESQAGSQSDAA